MSTTLRISFWRTIVYLIVALPSAYFGILGMAWAIKHFGWYTPLFPLSWTFAVFCIVSAWSLFLWFRCILTPNWIEIGKDGIHYHTLFSLHKTFVAWQDIDDFYVRTVNGKNGASYFLYYFSKQDPKPSPKYFWQGKKKTEIPLAEMVRGGMRAVIQAICEHCPLERLTLPMSPDDYL